MVTNNHNTVTFCVIEPQYPFICDVNGQFNIDSLIQIETQFIEEPLDYPEGLATITYECNWWSGQYDHEGRCELAPCWEMTEVSRVTLAEELAKENK